MRVLYVEAAYSFGGSLTGLLHLFDALPSHVEPILVTSFDPTPFVALPASLTHRMVDIPQQRSARGRIATLLNLNRYFWRPWRKSLLQLVDEYKPDLIHSNNTIMWNLPVAAVGRKRQIPTVAHEKGWVYPGKLPKFLYSHSRFTHHIATSGAIASHMLALGLDPQRCTTIYEPVRGPSNDCVAQAGRNAVPIISMHSMLTRWKGQHVFLRAVAEVRRRVSAPFRVVVAGTSPAGEKEYVAELHRLVDELNLRDLVEFPGHVRDVYEFLSTVDIAVHAAIDPEPFGRVAAEAMLCGLPGIVTSDGGPAEYVEDGVTGLHVPRNDAGAMANAIVRLLASVELRAKMGEAARQYALEAFEPTHLAKQTVELYHHLLGGKDEDSSHGGDKFRKPEETATCL